MLSPLELGPDVLNLGNVFSVVEVHALKIFVLLFERGILHEA